MSPDNVTVAHLLSKSGHRGEARQLSTTSRKVKAKRPTSLQLQGTCVLGLSARIIDILLTGTPCLITGKLDHLL